MKDVASPLLKLFYCITLFNFVAPAMIFMTGFTSMMRSGPLIVVGMLVYLIPASYRIYLVATIEGKLDAPVGSQPSKIMRKFGIFCIFIGGVGTIVAWAGALIGGISNPNMGTGLLLGMGITGAYFLTYLGNFGLVIFEFSRLLGFEQSLRASGAPDIPK